MRLIFPRESLNCFEVGRLEQGDGEAVGHERHVLLQAEPAEAEDGHVVLHGPVGVHVHIVRVMDQDQRASERRIHESAPFSLEIPFP